ncbi:antibiotic biosynthesis monooxygenase [bacterium]|jgi:quinol monooxygenase YgiN|nr:antibiotic biosynthesis monooxygenase [bacterium]|tara:strand:+ start:225 stop:518 length:294 start_codon:yes stop_codon:yes gene_type:complete
MKYGLSGSFTAVEGKGGELASILEEAANLMKTAKGCLIYIVGQQSDDKDIVHVFEVWDSKQDHDDSLSIDGVRELIGKAMPIIDGKPSGTEIDIAGG